MSRLSEILDVEERQDFDFVTYENSPVHLTDLIYDLDID